MIALSALGELMAGGGGVNGEYILSVEGERREERRLAEARRVRISSGSIVLLSQKRRSYIDREDGEWSLLMICMVDVLGAEDEEGWNGGKGAAR